MDWLRGSRLEAGEAGRQGPQLAFLIRAPRPPLPARTKTVGDDLSTFRVRARTVDDAQEIALRAFTAALLVASISTFDQGRAVYHRGRAIKLFAGGQSHVLAFAAAPPIGLSIEGRRVTWAENLKGRGRIRSVLISTQN